MNNVHFCAKCDRAMTGNYPPGAICTKCTQDARKTPLTFEEIQTLGLRPGDQVEWTNRAGDTPQRAIYLERKAKRGRRPKYFANGRWHDGQEVKYYDVRLQDPNGTTYLEETFYVLRKIEKGPK